MFFWNNYFCCMCGMFIGSTRDYARGDGAAPDVGDAEAASGAVSKRHIRWDITGLVTTITDDAQRTIDVARLGDEKYVKAFEELQRMGVKSRVADFWRYAKIYLDGGVYADIDVTPSEGFTKKLYQRGILGYRRRNDADGMVGPGGRLFGSHGHSKVLHNTLLRFWQQRLGILVRHALDLCVENIQNPTFQIDKEPIASLGVRAAVLTDAVRYYLFRKSPG